MNSGDERECWDYWRLIQFGIVADLFVTLLLVFWFNIVLTSYVHSLHPHIFYDDSDSEDERYGRWLDEQQQGMPHMPSRYDTDEVSDWSDSECGEYEHIEDVSSQQLRHRQHGAGSTPSLNVLGVPATRQQRQRRGDSRTRHRSRGRSSARSTGSTASTGTLMAVPPHQASFVHEPISGSVAYRGQMHGSSVDYDVHRYSSSSSERSKVTTSTSR